MFFNYHRLLPKTQSNEVFDWSSIIIGDYDLSSMQRLSLHLSKCHIFGNHMSWLFFLLLFLFLSALFLLFIVNVLNET